MGGLKSGWQTGEDALLSESVYKVQRVVSVSAVPREQAQACGVPACASGLGASCRAHLEVTPHWRGAAAVWGRLAAGQQGSGGLECTETPEQLRRGLHSPGCGRGSQPWAPRARTPFQPSGPVTAQLLCGHAGFKQQVA